MEYLLEASGIIVLFYIFYKLFLERETFFQSNRIFLLGGIVAALLIPLLVIPMYVEVPLADIQSTISTTSISNIQEVPPTFDWIQFLQNCYLIGLIIFGIKFLMSLGSLLNVILFKQSEKLDGYRYIQTTKEITPFSFFNYIIYNPKLYRQEDLVQILTHEKVHAYQWHSIDVLVSQIFTMLFWFNPISWFYKKDLQQNLEFLADAVSQEQLACEKSYQKLLLKTSISNVQLALANNFYNSLIKKRIIMLQKNKSNSKKQWKYALILPLIAAFIFTFNTKLVAQKTEVKEVKEIKKSKDGKQLVRVKEIEKNVEAFLITKNTKDFEKLKEQLSDKGITAKFKNVKRNESGEIIGIKIDLKSSTSNANFSMSSDEPIKTIKISFNKEGSNISIGNASEHLMLHDKGENVFLIKKEHGEHEIHKIKSDGNKVIEIKHEDGTHEVIDLKGEKNVWVTKDGDKTIEIKHDGDMHEVIEIKEEIHKDGEEKHEVIEIKGKSMKVSKDGSKMTTYGDDIVNPTIEFTDSEEKPLIIVNGKEHPYTKMKNLDSDTIESISIIKGEQATKQYGEKGEHGVIEIITKK